MKVKCLQEKLKNALGLVQRAVGKNANLPILSNVYLETEKGRLKIATTDLEIGIETWITSKVEEEGKVTVPAQTLSNFVSSLPQDRVTLESEDTNLKVTSDNMKAKFNGLKPSEFPIIPKVDTDPIFKIKGTLLAQSFSQVLPACSFSDTRPEISGLYLTKGDKKEIKIAATDSFRLAEKTIKAKLGKDKLDLIVPLKTVQEVARALKTETGKVLVSAQDNQIEFKFKDTRIISRLIEGDFPDYEKIIPTDFSTKVVLQRDQLQDAIQRASFFSSKINDVRLNVKKEKVSISARSQKVGENISVLEAKNEGDEVVSVFNYNYLLDGLKNIETEKVILNFSGEENPVLAKPFGKSGYLYLVMPIKDTG